MNHPAAGFYFMGLRWDAHPWLIVLIGGAYVAGCAWTVGWLVFSYARAIKIKPRFAKGDIVYQERFASGASQRNLMTKCGGGRNCVRLVVTRDFLWVTSWFPFVIFAAFYDMVHYIPLPSITGVKRQKRFGMESLMLSYHDPAGHSHTLRLIPKNGAEFLAAIGKEAV